eukprot:121456_1
MAINNATQVWIFSVDPNAMFARPQKPIAYRQLYDNKVICAFNNGQVVLSHQIMKDPKIHSGMIIICDIPETLRHRILITSQQTTIGVSIFDYNPQVPMVSQLEYMHIGDDIDGDNMVSVEWINVSLPVCSSYQTNKGNDIWYSNGTRYKLGLCTVLNMNDVYYDENTKYIDYVIELIEYYRIHGVEQFYLFDLQYENTSIVYDYIYQYYIQELQLVTYIDWHTPVHKHAAIKSCFRRFGEHNTHMIDVELVCKYNDRTACIHTAQSEVLADNILKSRTKIHQYVQGFVIEKQWLLQQTYDDTNIKWKRNNICIHYSQCDHVCRRHLNAHFVQSCYSYDPEPNIAQCKVQSNNTDQLSDECVLDYHERCTMQYAQKTISESNSEYVNALSNIHDLTYMVDNRHGGVQLDVISFLYYKLNIPRANIFSYCTGFYCNYLETSSHKYWNVIDSKEIHTIYKEIPGDDTEISGFKYCCSGQTTSDILKHANLTRFSHYLTAELTSRVPSFHGTFDIVICGFPGVQCLGYLGVAKVILIRFSHRYDHHVWNKFGGRVKWTQILNSIATHCSNKQYNILMFVNNIYDWFYLKYSVRIDDDRLYLWPNFAQHFATEFAMPTQHNTSNIENTSGVYLYQDDQGKRNCLKETLNLDTIKQKLAQNEIDFETSRSVSKKYLFNRDRLHWMVHGVVVMPYAVHTAKWNEFYSVGTPLFFPSVRLWTNLQNTCSVIIHRQYGNAPTRDLDTATPKELYHFVKYSPCCGANPFTNQHAKTWLPFSDYYNDQLFKYVIYYDNETDLIHKITQHHHDIEYETDKIHNVKIKQINEWDMVSDTFKTHIASRVWKAYQTSLNRKTNCIPQITQNAQCIISQDV